MLYDTARIFSANLSYIDETTCGTCIRIFTGIACRHILYILYGDVAANIFPRAFFRSSLKVRTVEIEFTRLPGLRKRWARFFIHSRKPISRQSRNRCKSRKKQTGNNGPAADKSGLWFFYLIFVISSSSAHELGVRSNLSMVFTVVVSRWKTIDSQANFDFTTLKQRAHHTVHTKSSRCYYSAISFGQYQYFAALQRTHNLNKGIVFYVRVVWKYTRARVRTYYYYIYMYYVMPADRERIFKVAALLKTTNRR